MVILCAAMPLIGLKVSQNSPLFILWMVVMSIIILLLIYSSFRIIFVTRSTMKALKTYCESLDLAHEPFTITGVVKIPISNPIKLFQAQKKAPGKYSFYSEAFSHF